MHQVRAGRSPGKLKAQRDALTSALRVWADELGEGQVLVGAADLGRFTDNCSGVARSVPAVVRPANVEQVQAAVRIASRTGQPIHPISRGKNWGLGSKLPVVDDVVILDLSELDAVREVGVKPGYADLETGVTQGQLHDRLERSNLPVRADVTGAGRGASVVGNILERGVGWTGLRMPALLGLEVVLASGELVRTGFWGHGDAAARSGRAFAHGPGPALDGLFTQSAMGVVTAARIALRPRQPVEGAFLLAGVREPELEELVDGLRGLLERGVIRTVAHIGDARRARAALGDRSAAAALLAGGWAGMGGLHGTKADVRHALQEIRAALKGVARVVFLTPRRLKWIDRLTGAGAGIEPIVGMAVGVPHDAAVRGLYEGPDPAPGESPDLDHGRAGLFCHLPVFPLDGQLAREVLDRTHVACAAHAVRPRITLNTLDPRTLEAVIDLPFDREDPQARAAAAACHDDLFTGLAKLGVLPYRLHSRQLRRFVHADDPLWTLVGDLKRAVDPAGVISPGRYAPPP